jgi:hypothetical protein
MAWPLAGQAGGARPGPPPAVRRFLFGLRPIVSPPNAFLSGVSLSSGAPLPPPSLLREPARGAFAQHLIDQMVGSIYLPHEPERITDVYTNRTAARKELSVTQIHTHTKLES